LLFFGARGREPPPLETRAWFHSIRSRFDSGSIRFDSAGETSALVQLGTTLQALGAQLVNSVVGCAM